MKIVVLLSLLLAGCATLEQQPPVYGCQNIPEFCPDLPPAPDDDQ